MTEADDIVLEVLLDDVLDATIVQDAVDEALGLIVGGTGLHGNPVSDGDRLLREIAKVEAERARLVTAIATGGALDALLSALHEREARLATLRAERAAVRPESHLRPSDAATVRRELLDLAGSWRDVLAHDQAHARPIVAALLNGRVTITPMAQPKVWELRGEGTLAGLFSRSISQLVWRPHRDSSLCGTRRCQV